VPVVRNLLVCLAAGAVAAVAPLLGCGREAGAPDSLVTASQGARAESLDLPPLPEWAPENPSPEFLRAARILQEIPMERDRQEAGGDPAAEALLGRYRRMWPSAYEFFGTLNDEQLERFLARKTVRIPVKSLTTRQRLALDRWFEALREAMRGGSPEHEDHLIMLYKMGARNDLANVDVGFSTMPEKGPTSATERTHRVHVWFWVRKPGGGDAHLAVGFAQI
jgi:hypothetical protein